MNEYSISLDENCPMYCITYEVQRFKERLSSYLDKNSNNSNFEECLNAEAEILLSRINFRVEEFKNTINLSNENSKIALQKAKCIIKLQNLSRMIADHVQNSNNS